MKIRFFFLFLLIYNFAWSQFVSQEIAEKAALGFYFEGLTSKNLPQKDIKVTSVFKDIDSLTGKTNFFAINFSDTGFVLISGTDVLPPVLGYSYTSFFSGNNYPVQLKGLLQEYRLLVNHVITSEPSLRENNADKWLSLTNNQIKTPKDNSIVVSELIPCLWDQGAGYNSLCPEDPAGPQGHVYAGCVATAMAMMMYYYRYPDIGNSNRGYYSDYGYLYSDFSQSVYNWSNMPYKLIGQSFDVAKLLSDCGISVDMMYSPGGSGAYMDDAAYALKTYFKYNPDLRIEYRDNYSLTSWKSLLKNQLNQGMPLIYAGYDLSGPGHAFVCDGYDSNDYFHYNWGWSGYYNGYYMMDYLTPAGYNFSTWQMAFIDAYPNNFSYSLNCGNSSLLTNSQGSIVCGNEFSNYSNNLSCSWLIAPESATEKITARFLKLNTEFLNDTVCIYDGETTDAPLLGRFSGNNIPTSDVQSTSDRMLITFNSNNTLTESGFTISFNAQKKKFCEFFKILTEPEGTIEDGSGDTYTYNENTLCRWLIKPDGAGAIVFDFDNLDTEPENDAVIFFDSSVYPSKEVIRFSGNTIPETYTYLGSSVVVLFTSDGFENKNGWKLHYTSWTLSVSEKNKDDIIIYPNPFVNTVHLSNYSEIATAEITDISGKTIRTFKFTNDTNSVIDLSDLNSGVYFLRLSTGKNYTVRKLVKL